MDILKFLIKYLEKSKVINKLLKLQDNLEVGI